MIVVEHERIELDYCVQCHGVWFDAGELELMLKSLGLDAAEFSMAGIMVLQEEETDEKKRKCPLCRKKMKKVIIGREPEVLIDACTEGEGLWFDGGEVGQIIKQLVSADPDESNTQGRVVTFLGETFKSSE
jgi:Zn-finger nucleic acid-binding protein